MMSVLVFSWQMSSMELKFNDKKNDQKSSVNEIRCKNEETFSLNLLDLMLHTNSL